MLVDAQHRSGQDDDGALAEPCSPAEQVIEQAHGAWEVDDLAALHGTTDTLSAGRRDRGRVDDQTMVGHPCAGAGAAQVDRYPRGPLAG
ncbi:hypothetical protein ACFPJ1_11915 [Kribbella qitaiheensis]|uniref:hypothetical protein n=1 Tax=Kribbella qitaiheensis TaxID=1544730 RepID=UPI00361B087B